MKTSFKTISGRRGHPCKAVATAGLLLLGGLAVVSQASPFARPDGPEGSFTWDCIESGTRDGVALVTFSSDFTFAMQGIIVPRPHKGSSDPSSRDGGSTATRNGFNVNTFSFPLFTNIFGSVSFPSSDITNTTEGGTTTIEHVGTPAGQWGFDTRGNVIGFFTEISAHDVCFTNFIPVATNFVQINPTTFTTNIVYTTNIDCHRLTNAVSFTARVTTGKRLTMLCSTPSGKATFQGLPAIALTNISGAYYGTKKDHRLPYSEFFSLNLFDPAFNGYTFDGAGPGYSYSGEAIVSRRKKIGFVADVFPGSVPVLELDQIVRATVGSINLRNMKFSSTGLEQTGSSPDNRIIFQGSRNPQ